MNTQREKENNTKKKEYHTHIPASLFTLFQVVDVRKSGAFEWWLSCSQSEVLAGWQGGLHERSGGLTVHTGYAGIHVDAWDIERELVTLLGNLLVDRAFAEDVADGGDEGDGHAYLLQKHNRKNKFIV